MGENETTYCTGSFVCDHVRHTANRSHPAAYIITYRMIQASPSQIRTVTNQLSENTNEVPRRANVKLIKSHLPLPIRLRQNLKSHRIILRLLLLNFFRTVSLPCEQAAARFLSIPCSTLFNRQLVCYALGLFLSLNH